MFAVNMDLTKDENLDFAIYNLILQQGKSEFTEDIIVDQLKACTGILDDVVLEKSVRRFLNFWVERDLLQQHWNRYSIA